MFLNQRNSYRFKRTPSTYRWRYWLPCPTDSPIACLDRGSRANRLFEVSARSSAAVAAPALQMHLQNPLARKPGSAVSSGCCVDPLRPQSLAALPPNDSLTSAFERIAAVWRSVFRSFRSLRIERNQGPLSARSGLSVSLHRAERILTLPFYYAPPPAALDRT